MKHRILVVDDDALVRRSVERILVRAGHEVHVAANVAEAVGHANRVPIEVALVDFALTEEDGLQVLARLREIQPTCLRILMTGRTDFPMVVDAVNRGEVLKVLRKPFDAPSLVKLVEDAFDSARRIVELANAQQHASNLTDRSMLEDAIRDDLLQLAVQPIVEAGGKHGIVAFEALLRSRHPVLDGPASLLQVAERSHRIELLGRHVVELAARRLPGLPENAGLFVNLHPQQLSDQGSLEDAFAPLIPFAHRITLEITERSRLNDIQGWDRTIDSLVQLGFSVAIDDLGAGYNSLAMLADLQPKYIKLDMSLIRNVDREPRKQRLVQLMATFADATNATLIAEGVETAPEAKALVDCGTHLLQGYFFGRPTLEKS